MPDAAIVHGFQERVRGVLHHGGDVVRGGMRSPKHEETVRFYSRVLTTGEKLGGVMERRTLGREAIRRLHGLHGFFILMLLGLCCAVAMSGSAAGQERVGSTISGRVTDAASGLAVPGARIELTGSDLATTSDAQGGYVFSAVAPGTYHLHVYVGDLIEIQQVKVVEQSDWVIDLPLSSTGSVRVTRQAALVPEAAGRIQGRVTTVGRPARDVQVYLANTGLRGITGVGGEFTIPAVPAGSYRLRAERIALTEVETRVTVAEGDVLTVEFALRPASNPVGEVWVSGLPGPKPHTVREVLDSLARAGHTPVPARSPRIVGRVVDAVGGFPVTDITISLVGTDRTVTALASGEYVILDIPVGEYLIRAEGRGRRTVESRITIGARETQVDFLMVPDGA